MLTHVLPVDTKGLYKDFPHVVRFEKDAVVLSTSRPLIQLVCLGNNGRHYVQLLVGGDGCGHDAAVGGFFDLVSMPFVLRIQTQYFHIRTCRVVALNDQCRVIESVSGTRNMSDAVPGSEGQATFHTGSPWLRNETTSAQGHSAGQTKRTAVSCGSTLRTPSPHVHRRCTSFSSATFATALVVFVTLNPTTSFPTPSASLSNLCRAFATDRSMTPFLT